MLTALAWFECNSNFVFTPILAGYAPCYQFVAHNQVTVFDACLLAIPQHTLSHSPLRGVQHIHHHWTQGRAPHLSPDPTPGLTPAHSSPLYHSPRCPVHPRPLDLGESLTRISRPYTWSDSSTLSSTLTLSKVSSTPTTTGPRGELHTYLQTLHLL